MDYLAAYNLSEHYDSDVRQANYRFFKNENLPATLDIVKNAVNRGVVNKKKWMPVLELFFEKCNEFLEDGDGTDDSKTDD